MGVYGSAAQLKARYDEIRDLEAAMRGDTSSKAWKELDLKLTELKRNLNAHIDRVKHDSNTDTTWLEKYRVL